jgi:hypothetical protein
LFFLVKGDSIMDPVILLALLNETLRDAYGLLFAEQGYRVLTASKVLECLHKVRYMAPEVLVLDEELWAGEDGLWAISGEDVLWPSVVLLMARGSETRYEIPVPPVVTCLERPADFGQLLDEVTEARRIFLFTGGNAAQGSAMHRGVGVPSRLLDFTVN